VVLVLGRGVWREFWGVLDAFDQFVLDMLGCHGRGLRGYASKATRDGAMQQIDVQR
jgi:hypothetical protein